MALGKTVRQLQQEIDAGEFEEWIAYNAVSPIGEFRDDLRMGKLAASIVGALLKTNRLRPIDFMPSFEIERRQQTAEEMQASLRLLALSMKNRRRSPRANSSKP